MPDALVLDRALPHDPAQAASAPPAAPRRSRRSRRDMVANVALTVGAILMIFPFVWTVITSFTSEGNVLSTPKLIPDHPGLEGYRQLFAALPFWRILLNSVGVAVVATVTLVATSAMAAYAFARFEFRGKNVAFLGYMATIMIPQQVLVVPLFIEVRQLNLVDTYAGLLAPTLASAFGVFMLRQAIAVVPRELDEAAFLDGAGHVRIFFRIVLPLIRPALATYGLLAFMSSWNNFLWPLVVIRSPEFQTLPLAVAGFAGEHQVEWNSIMAGSVVSILPMLLLYLGAQRHIVQSVAQAGLK